MLIENFLDEINKELKNKLSIQDIDKILDITDSFSDEFKSKIAKGQDIKNKKVYCVILKDNVTDRQLIECIRSLIVTKDSFVLFYNQRMRLD